MDQPLHLQLENAIVCVLTVCSFVLIIEYKARQQLCEYSISVIYHHGKYNVTKMYLFCISYLRMTIVGLLLRFGISLCPTWRERHVAVVVVTHDEINVSIGERINIKG